jgi:CheY-like chemotaxis protein
MTPQNPSTDSWKDRAAELLRLGLEELDNERYESAAQMLLDSLTVYEAHRDEEGSLSVATYLGFALYEQGREDRAVSVWEEILRRGTSLPTVYTLLAKHYKRMGQEEEVRRVFEAMRETGALDSDAPTRSDAGDPRGASGDAGSFARARGERSADGTPLVLVADDEPGICKLMERFLTGLGYEVEVAGDGEEALLAILHRNPDLILMDVYMPKRTGLDVLLKMRAEGMDRPVIMISGYANASFVQDGLALGADFLPKPIDLDDLEGMVKHLLAEGRPEASAEDTVSDSTSPPSPDIPPGDTT